MPIGQGGFSAEHAVPGFLKRPRLADSHIKLNPRRYRPRSQSKNRRGRQPGLRALPCSPCLTSLGQDSPRWRLLRPASSSRATTGVCPFCTSCSPLDMDCLAGGCGRCESGQEHYTSCVCDRAARLPYWHDHQCGHHLSLDPPTCRKRILRQALSIGDRCPAPKRRGRQTCAVYCGDEWIGTWAASGKGVMSLARERASHVVSLGDHKSKGG